MRHRIIATLAGLALTASPLAVHAQESPAPGAIETLERALLERLCTVDVAEDADLAACLLTAADALTGNAIDLPAAVEEAVASAREVDLRAALAEAVAAVGATDLQARIDEALTATTDVDVEAAVAEALSAIDGVDLQQALDDALASLQGAVPDVSVGDLEGWLAAGLLTARGVVAEAQAWVEENPEAICAGGSLGVAAAVAVVVAHLTGDPVLAVGAFEESERLSSEVCTAVAA